MRPTEKHKSPALPSALALAGLVAALFLAPGLTRAEGAVEGAGDAPSLSWVRLPGAEECTGAGSLARAVEERLGSSRFASPARADVSIEGRVEPLEEGSGRFRATLVIADAEGRVEGERVLESDERAGCRSLDDGLILVIAVMLDPDAALDLQAEAAVGDVDEEQLLDDLGAGEPDETGEEQTSPDEIPRAAPAEAEDPPEIGQEAPGDGEEPVAVERLVTIDGVASFSAGLGMLPTPSLGGAVTFVFDFLRFPPVELTVGAVVGATATQGDAGARFDQVYGRLAVCVPWGPRIVQLHGCAGIGSGATFVGGHGVDLPQRQARPVFDAVAGLRVLYRPVGPLVLRLGATAVVPVLRDRFVFVDERGEEQELFEPSSVGGAVELGIGVELY